MQFSGCWAPRSFAAPVFWVRANGEAIPGPGPPRQGSRRNVCRRLSSSLADRAGRFDSTDTGLPTKNMATSEEGARSPVHADRGQNVAPTYPNQTLSPYRGQLHLVRHLARVQRGSSQLRPRCLGHRCRRCSLKCQVRLVTVTHRERTSAPHCHRNARCPPGRFSDTYCHTVLLF